MLKTFGAQRVSKQQRLSTSGSCRNTKFAVSSHLLARHGGYKRLHVPKASLQSINAQLCCFMHHPHPAMHPPRRHSQSIQTYCIAISQLLQLTRKPLGAFVESISTWRFGLRIAATWYLLKKMSPLAKPTRKQLYHLVFVWTCPTQRRLYIIVSFICFNAKRKT